MSTFDTPFYSVCKIGPSRFFWAAWASYEAICNHQTLGSGYAATREVAHADAGTHGHDYGRAGFAAEYHHYLATQRRLERMSGAPDTAAPTEYLYTEWLSDCDNRSHWSAHRIIKRTAKKVFVQRQELSAEHLARHPEDLRMIALDRQKLEKEGHATYRRHYDWYYTEEAMRASERHAYCPPSITALGLSWPCTLDELKATWRKLARTLHPDQGGNATSFHEMRSHYEMAVQMVGGAK